jgi:hypothetical protein
MQTVIETGPFIRDAGAAGMTEDERFALINFIGANPDAGDVIKGSGGCRKVRFAKAGKVRAAAIGSSRSIRARMSRCFC